MPRIIPKSNTKLLNDWRAGIARDNTNVAKSNIKSNPDAFLTDQQKTDIVYRNNANGISTSFSAGVRTEIPNTTNQFVGGKQNPNAIRGLENVSPEFFALTGGSAAGIEDIAGDLIGKGISNVGSKLASKIGGKAIITSKDIIKNISNYKIPNEYVEKVTKSEIDDYRKLMTDEWKFDASDLTDSHLRTMIAANEHYLNKNATGVLKNNVNSHVGGIFDKWDPTKLASQTGDNGFYGAGQYFTPNQRVGYGFTGRSQPYIVSGVENPIRLNASPYIKEGMIADQDRANKVLSKLQEKAKPYSPVLGNHMEWNDLYSNKQSIYDAVIQREGYRPENIHTDKELVVQPGVDKPNFWQKSLYGRPDVYGKKSINRILSGSGKDLINYSIIPAATGTLLNAKSKNKQTK